jgi:transcriptional regulator with XRE-family HTH domain
MHNMSIQVDFLRLGAKLRLRGQAFAWVGAAIGPGMGRAWAGQGSGRSREGVGVADHDVLAYFRPRRDTEGVVSIARIYVYWRPMQNVSQKQTAEGARRDPLSVGANIHRFRLEGGMTLKDLAEKSGVSIATISKIENGKNSGGFETIYKIARGLGVLVTEIIKPENGGGQRIVVHRCDDTDLHPTGIYDYFPQAFRREGSLNPYIMVIHTRSVPDKRDWSIHGGEEVVFVASGALDLYLEDREPEHLDTGDSACFDSGARHAFVCTSKTPACIFSVSTRGPSRAVNGRHAFSR